MKKCARHPLGNLEESSSRIAIRNGDRVTFYPSFEPESRFDPLSADKQAQDSLRSSSPSASNSVSHCSPNNVYSLPQGSAVPPVPVPHRRPSNIDSQNTPPKTHPYGSRSNSRNFQPLIPEPIIHRQRKKSAPVLHSAPPAADRNVCAYSQPEQDNQILRKSSSRDTRRRINTYHEGDSDYTSIKYHSNNIQISYSSRNQSGPIPQTGRKALEKPPAGKPRGRLFVVVFYDNML